MGKIITKTVEQKLYVSANGTETLLTDMTDAHLVNAFGQAAKNDIKPSLSWSNATPATAVTVKELKGELLRRLALVQEKV